MHSSVYLMMGVAGSGRRQVLADLVESGLPAGTSVALYFAEDELPCPAASEALSKQEAVKIFSWSMHNSRIVAAPPPNETEVIFFVLSGVESPVDALEAFPDWLSGHDLRLTRVLTVIDAEKTHAYPIVQAWYDACLHFSDVALFTHRGGTCPVGWVEAYIESYRKACYPCLFIQLKKKQVDNPALVLDPTVRRLSQAFDSAEDFEGDFDDIIEGDVEEVIQIDGAPIDMSVVDPYFVRLPNGNRAKPVQRIEL